jgi:hypothetical protein
MRFAPHSIVEHSTTVRDEAGALRAANERLCRQVGEALQRLYPFHPWAVSAEIEHGIVKVALTGFQQWPWVIHVDTLKGDPGMSIVRRAGGELLERFKMPRAAFSPADWMTATQRMPWHFNRNKQAPV